MNAKDISPLVSVVIPVYNAEKYLRQTLDSVLAQTLNEIEIICVDDGSTDSSLEILKSYEQRDERVRLLTTERSSAGAARNAGLELCRGEYVVFLDADDFFEPDLLLLQYQTASSKNADICICSADKYNTEEDKYTAVSSWMALPDVDVVYNIDSLGSRIFSITNGAPWNKMFKREFINKNGLRFQNLPRANDIYFVLSSLALAERIVGVNKVLVHYRTQNSSSLQANNKLTPTAFISALSAVYDRLNISEATKELKIAFANIALQHIAYNLRTLERTAEDEIVESTKMLIGKSCISSFGISALKESEIFSEGDYKYLNSLGLIDIPTPSSRYNGPDECMLSFIIPVYNAEEYIGECLESILIQPFSDYEIICVDDASKDGSASVIKEYSQRDSRVKLIRHEVNKHQGGARNTGLDHAKGKYVWFVDADDMIDTNSALLLVRMMEELSDVDLIGFHADAFIDTEEGRVPYPEKNIRQPHPKNTKLSLPADNDKMPDAIDGSSVVYMTKRSFINKYRFRENVFFEDADFSFRIFTDKVTLYFIDFVLYKRRVSADSTTGKSVQTERAETNISRILASLEISNIILLSSLDQNHFAVRWFSRWAKYVITLYLNNPQFHREDIDMHVREIERRHGLFSEKEKYHYPAVFDIKHPDTAPSENYKRLYETYKREVELIHKSFTYRIGRVMTFFPRKIRGGIRCLKEHGIKYTLKRVLVKLRIIPDPYKPKKKKASIFKRARACIKEHGVLYTLARVPVKLGLKKDPYTVTPTYAPEIALKKAPRDIPMGLSKTKHSPELIVSLTSFPARIPFVSKTIKTILKQTERPDKVILWLASEQFPSGEAELPRELTELKKHGLTIGWCNDIRSYKKLIPTLERYPEAIIVTADDDVYYESDWLEKLYISYKKWPNFIHVHRDSKVIWEMGEFKFIPGGKAKYPCPTYLHKLVGIGGVLYPPASLHPDVLAVSVARKLAPTNDDLWFWFMAIRNNRRIMVVEGNYPTPKYVEGSQQVESLTDINDKGPRLFYKDLSSLIDRYPKVAEKLIRESSWMHRYEEVSMMNPKDKNYDFYKMLNDKDLEPVVAEWFHRHTGDYVNFDCPMTYNEKIQWMKIYDNDPRKTTLADKYLVRDYVKQTIGEEYLVPLIGVYESVEEIDFSVLPEKFVIKATHGSGWNIVVKDKSKLDIADTKRKLNEWLNTNFAYVGLEYHYKDIKGRIIIEEYLENASGDLYDYKVFCFEGRAESVMFLCDRQNGLKMAFYDRNWKKLDYVYSFPKLKGDVEKPKNLALMIELSEKLSSGFPHARVDFYVLDDGTLKFGEITFSSANGKCRWSPREQDMIFGEMINLPEKTN